MVILALRILSVILVLTVSGAETLTCTKSELRNGYYQTTYINCDTACCGSRTFRYCCPNDPGLGKIIGSMFGTLVGICVIGGIVWMLVRKKSRDPGTVTVTSLDVSPSSFVRKHYHPKRFQPVPTAEPNTTIHHPNYIDL